MYIYVYIYISRDIKQAQKNKQSIIPYIWGKQNSQITKDRKQWLLKSGSRGEGGVISEWVQRLKYDEKDYVQIVVMGTLHLWRYITKLTTYKLLQG